MAFHRHNNDLRRLGVGYQRGEVRRRLSFLGGRMLQVDPCWARAVADAFEAAEHRPHDPETLSAYIRFCCETRAQFGHLTRGGIRVLPWREPGQPYENSRAMLDDVRRNRRLFVFTTSSGYGESNHRLDQSGNPLLEWSGLTIDGVRFTHNDLFRAVHDLFGHAMEGYGFGPRGELNAWRTHSRLYSWQARRAMTTETVGQNAWFSYGPHLRDDAGNLPANGQPGYVPLCERPFAEQKMTLLPDWITASADSTWASSLPRRLLESVRTLSHGGTASHGRWPGRVAIAG